MRPDGLPAVLDEPALPVDREPRCAVDEDAVDLVARLLFGEDAEEEPRDQVRAEDELAGRRDQAAVADREPPC